MIGQSGLPMMNNLAGSKENPPEEAQAKSAIAEAGAFERVLMPDAQVFADALNLEVPAKGQRELPIEAQGPSLIEAKTAKNTVLRTEVDPAQVVSSQFIPPTDAEIPMAQVFAQQSIDQQSVEPIAAASGTRKDEPSTRQSPDVDDQIIPMASESSEADLQSSEAEKPVTLPYPSFDEPKMQSGVSPDSLNRQTAELDTKATPPENPIRNTDQTSFSNQGRSDVVSVAQSQPKIAQQQTEAKPNELNNQPGKPPLEANRFASSADSSDFRATSTELVAAKAIRPVNEAEVRPSQQASPLSTALSPDRGSDAVTATQSRGVANPDLAVLRAERPDTSALLAAAQLSEKNVQPPQSLDQAVQNRAAPIPSFSELRTATAWGGAAPTSDSPPVTPVSYSVPAAGVVLKAMVSSSTPQFQTMTPETSFLAQSALSDQSEILLGPSTSIASTASARLDAPVAAPIPGSVDAKLVVQQLHQAIIRMDGARTEIMLDPVELGRVSLTFITKDEGVTVLITADRSETADLLRRNGEQLQRDLSNAGYDDVELDFNQGDDDRPDPSAADRFDETGTARSSSVSYEANFVTSGLDIRI